MNYALTPSLKDRCMTTIAIAVWNEHNLIQSALKLKSSSNPSEEWRNVEEKAKELLLPEALKKDLIYTINAIGFQVLTWMQFHFHLVTVYENVETGIKFYWTPQATIDKRKTAEALVKDESIGNFVRFRFASAYCLEQYIPILWNNFDKASKHTIKSRRRFQLFKEEESLTKEYVSLRKYERRLFAFWSFFIDSPVYHEEFGLNLQNNFSTSYTYAFECAAYGGNEVATKYFLQKLSDEEKQRMLVRVTCEVAKLANEYLNEQGLFPKNYYTSVLCLLLSVMNSEQQTEVFKKHPDYVLYCLLEWPWQGFFIKTAQQIWNFLSGYDYLNLSQHIIYEKIFSGYRDYNYQVLFGIFWEQSPSALKKFVLELFARRLLLDLFRIKDEENSILILRDLAHQQEKNCNRDICRILINEEKWNLLQFFLKECESSEEGKIKLNKAFEKIRFSLQEDLCEKPQLVGYLKLVEEFFMTVPERKDEEYDNPPSPKKFCP